MKITITALSAGIAAAALAYGALGSTTQTVHACKAPCVVTFTQPMAEDGFKIDYRHGGTLKVWKAQP